MAVKTHGALSFKIIAECKTTKARVGKMKLPHYTVDTPVFMPVGTQGTLKGMVPEQLEELDCKIMLGNTYHLGHRPGPDLLDKAGGLHKFMNWNRALLTDSGGFQMVSLLKLAEITEQGVKFESPHDGSEMMLTPEKSIEIQNSIGADIIMQLDDVVHSSTTGPRVEEAMWRTIRWLDRCLTAHKRPHDQNIFPIVQGGLDPKLRKKCAEAIILVPLIMTLKGSYWAIRWLDRCLTAHKRPHDQNIFPIVQGGLDPKLRKKCAEELTKRDVPGFAIGGLSGGEEKALFWRMVDVSTDYLPTDKPRYLMGVGFAVDLVVCVALGCDMFDCVYPTRTARFGNALVPSGKLNLNQQKYEKDFKPIDDQCRCSTCRNYTRAYLHMVIADGVASPLITVHNVAYQLDLMRSIQQSIIEDRFPDFIEDFFSKMFPDKVYPEWAAEALKKVGVHLKSARKQKITGKNVLNDMDTLTVETDVCMSAEEKDDDQASVNDKGKLIRADDNSVCNATDDSNTKNVLSSDVIVGVSKSDQIPGKLPKDEALK